MWLCLPEGFFSVVLANKDNGRSDELDPEAVMVRARRREHFDELSKSYPELSGFKIIENAWTDYRFRMILPKPKFADILAKIATRIDYAGFRAMAAEREKARGQNAGYARALEKTWETFRDMQQT